MRLSLRIASGSPAPGAGARTFLPDFKGLIEADDGAEVLIDYRGYGQAYPVGRRQIVAMARSHLINIWPASETMLPESIESHKWRENAAGSACLSQSNLFLPCL